MNPLVKKIVELLLPALIGSGITFAITDNIALHCKPVVEVTK